MKKILLVAAIISMMALVPSAIANHPLIQNGWLKAATENSVTIAAPKGGDMTFNISEKTKIRFSGEDGTAADIQALAAQMGSQRILINIRRDAPDSPNAVLVGLKAAKPASATPSSPPAPNSSPTPTESVSESSAAATDAASATE